MDDTAFHYSRTLRIIMVLAIVIPILGIGLLLWYFSSFDVPETLPAAEAEVEELAGLSGSNSADGTVVIVDNGAG